MGIDSDILGTQITDNIKLKEKDGQDGSYNLKKQKECFKIKL